MASKAQLPSPESTSADATEIPPEKPRKIPMRSMVYDPADQTLTFEATEILLVQASKNEVFEVPIPPWTNAVDVYRDDQRTDFLASVHLNKIGFKRNLQRRLHQDYFKLYVKASIGSPPPLEAFSSEREATETLFVLPSSRRLSSETIVRPEEEKNELEGSGTNRLILEREYKSILDENAPFAS